MKKLAYVDTSVWIMRLEGKTPYQRIVADTLQRLEEEGWTFCASELVKMEAYHKPYRNNDAALISLYDEAFAHTKILNNYQTLLKESLRVMRTERLKTLDALHVSLAVHHGCGLFVTADGDFKRLTAMTALWIDLSQASPQ